MVPPLMKSHKINNWHVGEGHNKMLQQSLLKKKEGKFFPVCVIAM